MMRRILLLMTVSFLAVQIVQAQVTTSSLTGNVRSAGNEPLVGATVTVIVVEGPVHPAVKLKVPAWKVLFTA